MEIFCEEISAKGGKIVINDRCGKTFNQWQAREFFLLVSSAAKHDTSVKRGKTYNQWQARITFDRRGKKWN